MNAKQIYTQAYSDRRAVKAHKMTVAEFNHKYAQTVQFSKLSVAAETSFVKRQRYGV
jgi:hypothetical protein